MKNEIVFVDAAIGQMVNELRHRGLLETTLIIVTAKHGQSPIDTNRFQKIGKGITTTPADVIAAFLPPPPSRENPNTPDKTLPDGTKLSAIGPTQDDISLLWLDPKASLAGAVAALRQGAPPESAWARFSTDPRLRRCLTRRGCLPMATLARRTFSCSRIPEWSSREAARNRPARWL